MRVLDRHRSSILAGQPKQFLGPLAEVVGLLYSAGADTHRIAPWARRARRWCAPALVSRGECDRNLAGRSAEEYQVFTRILLRAGKVEHCHSERSEESARARSKMLRFAQHDVRHYLLGLLLAKNPTLPRVRRWTGAGIGPVNSGYLRRASATARPTRARCRPPASTDYQHGNSATAGIVTRGRSGGTDNRAFQVLPPTR